MGNFFSRVHGGDALSFHVVADNQRNKENYATVRKTIEKKSTFVIYGLPSHRHFWTGSDGMKSKSQSERHKRVRKTENR